MSNRKVYLVSVLYRDSHSTQLSINNFIYEREDDARKEFDANVDELLAEAEDDGWKCDSADFPEKSEKLLFTTHAPNDPMDNIEVRMEGLTIQ